MKSFRLIAINLFLASLFASMASPGLSGPKTASVPLRTSRNEPEKFLPADSVTYEDLIDSAESYANRENWEMAVELYRGALRKNPSSPLNSKIFANLGLCLTELNQLEEALEAYSIALIKEPDSHPILYARARTLARYLDFDGAEADLEKILASDSTDVKALRLHGQLMLIDRNDGKALDDFKRLSMIAPDDAWAYAGQAEALENKGRLEEAIPLYKRAIELSDSPDIRMSLINAMIKATKYYDAENAIREALIIYPTVGEFYLLRGILHKKLHQINDVEIDKKYAIEYGVDPQTVEKYLPKISK